MNNSKTVSSNPVAIRHLWRQEVFKGKVLLSRNRQNCCFISYFSILWQQGTFWLDNAVLRLNFFYRIVFWQKQKHIYKFRFLDTTDTSRHQRQRKAAKHVCLNIIMPRRSKKVQTHTHTHVLTHTHTYSHTHKLTHTHSYTHTHTHTNTHTQSHTHTHTLSILMK